MLCFLWVIWRLLAAVGFFCGKVKYLLLYGQTFWLLFYPWPDGELLAEARSRSKISYLQEERCKEVLCPEGISAPFEKDPSFSAGLSGIGLGQGEGGGWGEAVEVAVAYGLGQVAALYGGGGVEVGYGAGYS